MIEFMIKPINFGFYIEQSNAVTDDRIANSIGISHNDYRKILKDKFNGKLFIGGEIFFEKYEDAKKALEWVESIVILNKLRGNNE